MKGGKQQVLIDGFPRNEENRAAFEAQVPSHMATPLHDHQCWCPRARLTSPWASGMNGIVAAADRPLSRSIIRG